MARVTLHVQCVARFSDGKEKIVGDIEAYNTCPVEEATTIASSIWKAVGNLGFTNPTLSTNPELWEPILNRRAKILFAYYLSQKRKEGIEIHPSQTRADVGQIIRDLNDQNPGLNVTLDEGMEIVEEAAAIVYEETFRKKRIKFGTPQVEQAK